MNIIVIAVAVVIVIALISLAAVICNLILGRRRQWSQYQNQIKSVLVKNGVNVKKQVMGGEKGEYFTGNLEKPGTCYVNYAMPTWKIVFDNLNTKERVYKEFSRQMWIGRTGSEQDGLVKLILPGDEKVSRNHCTIYESNGTLCLQDLNSSNHTYLNNSMIRSAVYLQNGDVIRVGDTQLRVQYS